MKQTATYQLIETKLGEPLAPFVARHLADERSLAWIARKLRERTGVEFSNEWLQRQFREQPASVAS